MTRRLLLATLALAALAVSPSPAAAAGATVDAPDGLAVTVLEVPVVVLPSRLTSALPDELGGGLAYQVVEPSGEAWHGTVPGTRGQAGDLVPSLACNPVTSDVMLAFAARSPGADFLDADVIVSTWLGQQWTEPSAAALRLHGASPVLAFRSGGDALLLWRAPTTLSERLLLRHADLTPAGESRVWSFSDLGNAWTHLGISRSGSDPRRVRAWLAPEAGRDVVHVVLADADSGSAVVLSVDVTALRDGGNGTTGAAPVPVSFHAGDDLDASSSSRTHSAGGGTSSAPVTPAGLTQPAWRLVADGLDAYFWTEHERLLVFVPAVGSGGTLLELTAPDEPLQTAAHVLRAVRRLVGPSPREGASSAAAGARRSR